MAWQDHISSKQNVCHGKACIAGTRIMVSVVLDNLAAGETPESVVANYPALTVADVYAALQYASELTKDRLIALHPAVA